MRAVYGQPGYTEADLHELLATRQFVFADCFTIIPLTGIPMRFTTAQMNMSVVPVGEVDRQTYFADKVSIKGLKSQIGIGVEVDEQTVEVTYGPGNLWQEILTFPKALLLGRADGATIRRDRFIAARFGSPWIAGTTMFTGEVAHLSTVGRMSATLNVKSALVKLNTKMPRDLWQPQCKNTWGDPICGLDQNVFAVSDVTLSGTTRTVIKTTACNENFAMGKLHIESSDNVVRVRTILKASTTELHLIFPLDFLPPDGTDFVAYPNCRRLFENCGDYHASPEEAFIGFPFVPVAETAA